jgi:hypothetical protein
MFKEYVRQCWYRVFQSSRAGTKKYLSSSTQYGTVQDSTVSVWTMTSQWSVNDDITTTVTGHRVVPGKTGESSGNTVSSLGAEFPLLPERGCLKCKFEATPIAVPTLTHDTMGVNMKTVLLATCLGLLTVLGRARAASVEGKVPLTRCQTLWGTCLADVNRPFFFAGITWNFVRGPVIRDGQVTCLETGQVLNIDNEGRFLLSNLTVGSFVTFSLEAKGYPPMQGPTVQVPSEGLSGRQAYAIQVPGGCLLWPCETSPVGKTAET